MKILEGVVATLLVGLCWWKTPCAWENFKAHGSTTMSIPHKKAHKKCWYVQPHKRLNRQGLTLVQVARKADKYKKVKKGFEAIRKASFYIDKSTLVAHSKEHIKKNRYRHLLPYDATRSCRELAGFYINANDVQTPLQSYLVTQGPLDSTVADFWQALLHRNSKTIVTLCMDEEEGKEKCANFWAIPEIEADGWQIVLQSEKLAQQSAVIPSHRIVIRTFIATKGPEKQTITQIHYENWPDGKTPELELFFKLLDEVDARAPSGDHPITVHCSAGLGRSGTFVAAHSLRKEVRQAHNHTIKINIPKAIFLMRCQRMGLVGTPRQYQIVCKTIANEHRPRQHPLFLF